MKTYLLNFRWLFILALGLGLGSCSESSDVADEATAETYAEETVFRTQESAKLGRFGCYELVFPVTVSFSDGTSVAVDSYETLKAAVKEWRKNNPRVRTRPTLAFPYEIINDEGEIISVTDENVQKELRQACRKDFFDNNGPNGHNHRPKICFHPVFPFSVLIPDGTIITLTAKEDRKLLHDAIKAWKESNPDSTERPELIFPLDVKLEDGTTVTVASKEELKLLKESCK